LSFIYLPGFVADCKRLKVSDEDIQQLEQELLNNPGAGKVVSRTGGVRKVRFSPKSRHTGKRGATRVLDAHFAVNGQVHFFVGYGKREQDDLISEQEAACRSLMSEINWLLAEKNKRGEQ
jgi:hypothetical protein